MIKYELNLSNKGLTITHRRRKLHGKLTIEEAKLEEGAVLEVIEEEDQWNFFWLCKNNLK